MEIRNAIMQMAEQDPQYAQAVDAMEARVANMPITPEDLDQSIKILEFVLQNPDKYQEVREAAIKDGDIDAQMVPEQFDQVFVVSLLIAFYGLQDRLKKQGYARGGLATAARHVASAGRGGDTQLAHINSREAEMLKRMGGSGTVNPNTGLQEYKSGKQLFSTLLPIALNFIVPGVGGMVGSALGATGVGASILGGAVIGGASSALGGGNVLKGALMGGLGGGLGNYAGGAASDALKLGLGDAGKSILGSGLVGGVAGLASGQGFLKGAATGAMGAYAGQQLGGMSSNPAFGAGAKQFGDSLSVGNSLKDAVTSGVASGLGSLATSMSSAPSANNLGLKPSTEVINNFGSSFKPTTMPSGYTEPNFDGSAPEFESKGLTAVMSPPGSYALTSGPATLPRGYDDQIYTGKGITAPASAMQLPAAGASKGFNVGSALTLASMLGSQGAPQQVQQAVSSLSPEQQEYFNRPSVSWDWDRMQNDASNSGLSLGQFMAQNLPRISGYSQAKPGEAYTLQGAYNQPKLARGGALSQIAYAVGGSGSGRDDTIDAKLSDGEYVMDAETVAMLGDGSGKAGAARLDQMRSALRAHKGRNLSRGKISPNAKSPLAYLKGVR